MQLMQQGPSTAYANTAFRADGDLQWWWCRSGGGGELHKQVVMDLKLFFDSTGISC